MLASLLPTSDSTNGSTRTLDHLVHLTPPGSIPTVIEQFRAMGLTVIEGGTHTDGFTSNALIAFADGVYIELIAFVHEPSYYPPGSPERLKRESHPWANKSPGWIDWALLGLDDHVDQIINSRSEAERSGVHYLPGQDGGRTTLQGKVLKWRVTSPDPTQHGRGTLPFFCQDKTPREWRVPADTQHKSTATGIAHITLISDTTDHLSSLSSQISSVLGLPSIDSKSSSLRVWHLDTPIPTHQPLRLVLRLPEGGGERATGIWEVGLYADRISSPQPSPYGKISWHSS